MTVFRGLLLLAALASAGCQAGEMLFVRSLGADMPVLMRGNAASGHVMVLVHGGPGGTSVPHYTESAFQAIEREVGVAYWDQRASGNAQGNPGPASLTLDQYVHDLDLVVDVIRQRQPGVRVSLMTHSWGGAIGAAYLGDAARQAKIAGWMPVAASVSIVECNRLSREWALRRAQTKAAGSPDPRWQEMVDWYGQHPTIGKAELLQHLAQAKKLGAYEVDPAAGEQVNVGGVLFASPHSVASELSNLNFTSQSFSLDELARLDLRDRLGAITLPTRVMNGRQDGIVPAPTAEDLYQRLATPAADKSLVYFEQSAHHPMAEEPAKFAEAALGFLRTLKPRE